MSKNDGGPAFPAPIAPGADWLCDASLRDVFAWQAIPSAVLFERESPTYEGPSYKGIAERAYLIADAMLAERAKDSP